MTGQVRETTTRYRLPLEFTGLDGGGGGELTWGQRFVWDILDSLAPANHYISIRFRVHLPKDVNRERVLTALHTLIRRHHALRTRFPIGPDGEPRQHCDPAGDLAVEFCEAEAGQVHRLAEQDEERLWRQPFSNEREWPVRVSVIVADGRPRQVVFVFSHLAVDAWGCWVFRNEFLELLRREGAEPARSGWQPRARSAFELSASGRQANDLALAYWRRVLETAPQTTFPVLPGAGETPLFPGVGVHSVALAAAAAAVASRHRVGPAAVLLAALSTIIGLRTGTEQVPLVLATGNRFTPTDTASVGTFYQSAPALVRLDTGSLAGTIRNAHKASRMAYLRGQSDPRDVARLLAAVNGRRGVDIDLQSTVNVMPEPGVGGRPTTTQDAADLRKMSRSTRVTDLEGRDSERLKLYVHVKSLRSRAVIELFCDSRFLTAAAARKVLAGLELVLIELLEVGDLSIDRVAELVGIAPLARPPRCAVVDNCWVDVDAVRGLLDTLPETVAAQAFVVGPQGGAAAGPGAIADGQDGGPASLVGYVVAAEPTTPERLHTALLSRLDGHLTMTPQWYVICRDAPSRLDSRTEWERQVVLCQGSGRADQPPIDADSAPSIGAQRRA